MFAESVDVVIGVDPTAIVTRLRWSMLGWVR